MFFIYWLCGYLDRFEGVLKKADVYEAIWASRYNQQINEELLKALAACWSSYKNTILTCYGELGISLWDIYQITGLPIMGEMY